MARSEGGNGREAFVDVSFPRAVKILDFQQGAGPRAGLAAVVRPGPAGAKRVAAWCHPLKQAGGAQVVKGLERLDARKLPEEARAAYARVRADLRKQVPRRDDPA
jgi:hypothetical protein